MARQAKFKVGVVPLTNIGLGKYATRLGKIVIIIAVLASLPGLAWIVNSTTRQDKFSDKDYATLSTNVEDILTQIGGRDVAKAQYCEYVAPEKYANESLFCVVKMAVYLPYESDSQAASIAKKFETKIAVLGQVSSQFQKFYDQPGNSSAVAVVVLPKSQYYEQCNFYVASNERAMSAVDFLPERTEDDLIALYFECDPESREEYFPVTNR